MIFLFALAIFVTVVIVGAMMVVGGVNMVRGAREFLDVFIGFILIAVPVIVGLGTLAVLTGDIKPPDPVIPDGCYRVTSTSQTYYAQSGQVLVPITTSHNNYFTIKCP